MGCGSSVPNSTPVVAFPPQNVFKDKTNASGLELHSKDLRTPKDFMRKKVVILGTTNSDLISNIDVELN